jgi:hypothetical protein
MQIVILAGMFRGATALVAQIIRSPESPHARIRPSRRRGHGRPANSAKRARRHQHFRSRWPRAFSFGAGGKSNMFCIGYVRDRDAVEDVHALLGVGL